MSSVDDPPSSGPAADDDAFAEAASALLGGSGDGDGDADAGPATSWIDPLAEAEEARRREDEAFADAEAARRARQRPTRGRARREWRQTERARRYAARRSVRFPIFTRSVLLWMLIFAIAGLMFGASGAFWWAQFNSQITQLKDDTRDFEQRSQSAQEAIDAERNAALTQIREANKPLAGFLSEALVVTLAQQFNPKVWAVATLDDRGQASVGSAFAVMSDKNETMMMTSFDVVKANALQPGPPDGIHLKKGVEDIKAELWATDPAHDLALLKVPRGNIDVMEWGPDDVLGRLLGSRVFMVSGWGGNGATLLPGLVVDVSQSTLRHTATLPMDVRGGPIINANGQVVGVASRAYFPAGFDPIEARYAPLVNVICERVLNCGGGKSRKPKDIVPPPTSTTVSTKPFQD